MLFIDVKDIGRQIPLVLYIHISTELSTEFVIYGKAKILAYLTKTVSPTRS